MVIEGITNEKLGLSIKNSLLIPHGLNQIQLPLSDELKTTPAIPWFDITGNGQLDNGQIQSLDSARMSARWAAGGMV